MITRNRVLSKVNAFLAFSLTVNSALIAPNAAFAREDMSNPPVPEIVIQTENIDEMRAPEAETKQLGEKSGAQQGTLVINIKGKSYVLPPPQLTMEENLLVNNMTDNERSLFQSNRALFLTKAAQLLSTAFVGNMWGTASLVGSNIKWAFNHMMGFGKAVLSPSESSLSRLSERQRNDILPDGFVEKGANEALEPIDPKTLKSFQERRHEAVLGTLRTVDRLLWGSPYMVTRSNEFGVYASIGVTTFAGIDMKRKGKEIRGGFGGSFDIGIFIGWNKSEATTVLQVFRVTEKFKSTLTGFTGNAAVVPKVGVMVADVQKGHEKDKTKGTMDYYPLVPLYKMGSQNRVAIGTNPSIGAVPFPFDAVISNSMDYSYKEVARISISAAPIKNFIMVYANRNGQYVSMARTSVQRVKDLVRVQFTGRSMCVSLHGM